MAWYWWIAIILGVLFLLWFLAARGWFGETAEIVAVAIAELCLDIDIGD